MANYGVKNTKKTTSGSSFSGFVKCTRWAYSASPISCSGPIIIVIMPLSGSSIQAGPNKIIISFLQKKKTAKRNWKTSLSLCASVSPAISAVSDLTSLSLLSLFSVSSKGKACNLFGIRFSDLLAFTFFFSYIYLQNPEQFPCSAKMCVLIFRLLLDSLRNSVARGMHANSCCIILFLECVP